MKSGPNRIVLNFGANIQPFVSQGVAQISVDGRDSDVVAALERAAGFLQDTTGDIILVSDGIVQSPLEVERRVLDLAKRNIVIDVIPIAPVESGPDDVYAGPLWVPLISGRRPLLPPIYRSGFLNQRKSLSNYS